MVTFNALERPWNKLVLFLAYFIAIYREFLFTVNWSSGHGTPDVPYVKSQNTEMIQPGNLYTDFSSSWLEGFSVIVQCDSSSVKSFVQHNRTLTISSPHLNGTQSWCQGVFLIFNRLIYHKSRNNEVIALFPDDSPSLCLSDLISSQGWKPKMMIHVFEKPTTGTSLKAKVMLNLPLHGSYDTPYLD